MAKLSPHASLNPLDAHNAGVATFIAKHAHAGDNAASKALASTCMCCIWCFEEIVRFVNKNAIIQLVLQSSDFITSAAAATRLELSGGPVEPTTTETLAWNDSTIVAVPVLSC